MRNHIVMRIAVLTGWILLGCGPTPKRLNAPPQGWSAEQPETHDFFDYQNDQGMMEDRSIADIHFIPHTATVNGTGIARLTRYAELLSERGGTLTYDTTSTDDQLVRARIAAAEKVLAEAVPDSARIDIVVGLPGGPGMEGTEAVTRRKEIQARNYNSESFSTKRDQDSYSFSGSGS